MVKNACGVTTDAYLLSDKISRLIVDKKMIILWWFWGKHWITATIYAINFNAVNYAVNFLGKIFRDGNYRGETT